MGIRDGIKELFSSKDDMDYPDHYDHRILSSYGHGRHGDMLPVMEMRVPLCCDNCEKKVREALEEVHGVKEVETDRDSNRVLVTGFVDPMKALRKVKKVKPKSELHGNNTYINRTSHAIERLDISPHSHSSHYVSSPLVVSSPINYDLHPDRHSGRYSERYSPHSYPYVSSPAAMMTRMDSYARRGPMNRLNSFGRVERYDERRDHGLVPLDVNRDFYNIRRMPSLGRHRYHDAEYISMGNEFHPAIAETRYVSAYDQRAANSVYRSQVSFSKLPVGNPNYIKQVEHEYNF